jgi:hypothetical protein
MYDKSNHILRINDIEFTP